MWKNWVTQKRRKMQLLLEMLLPVFFAAVLVLVRDLKQPAFYNSNTTYPSFAVGQDLSLLIPKVHNMSWSVAWTPNNTVVEQVLDNLARRCGLDVRDYGFATEAAMENFIMDSINRPEDVAILAGVAFTNAFDTEDAFPKDIQVHNMLIYVRAYIMYTVCGASLATPPPSCACNTARYGSETVCAKSIISLTARDNGHFILEVDEAAVSYSKQIWKRRRSRC